jgi:hypothetical protein
MQVGTGELAAGMAFLRESRDCFAGKTEVDDFELPGRVTGDEIKLEVFHVAARVGDAIAKEDDTFDPGEEIVRGADGREMEGKEESEKGREEAHGQME